MQWAHSSLPPQAPTWPRPVHTEPEMREHFAKLSRELGAVLVVRAKKAKLTFHPGETAAQQV